ncbi:hypothetical protein QT972_17890 [Microcoleus sp. herbarium7]
MAGTTGRNSQVKVNGCACWQKDAAGVRGDRIAASNAYGERC